jgi:hypothetical protein
MRDLAIQPLTGLAPRQSHQLLAGFRERFQRTSWSHLSRATLYEPVWSSAREVEQLETRLVALYRAHLKVLELALAEPPPQGPVGELVRLLRHVRAYYMDWPVIGEMGQLPLSQGEEARWLLYGRPDIVMGEQGPQLVETNFDTAVSGFEKPDDLWVSSAELFEPGEDFTRWGRPLQGLRRYFEDLSRGQECTVHWLMKDSEGARNQYDPLLQALEQESRGVHHRIHYAGAPVEPSPHPGPAWLHRACTIYTVNRSRAAFTATLEQLAPRVQGCTVPVGLSVLLSKLFLPWLSNPLTRPASLTPEEVEAVETLVPRTRLLRWLEGQEWEQVLHNHGDYVLKKTDSHLGKDVFFGCNLSAPEWKALLEQKRAAPELVQGVPDIWLVQERVRPREYHLIEHTDEGALERRTGLSCCRYLLGGRIRALETWITPFTPNHDMLHAMQFVGHFIR